MTNTDLINHSGYARVIADSIYGDSRLTTMEVRFHRFVLAEFNTHRAFSRNSASSRAIPISKRILEVIKDLAWPVEWGSNKPGMQAGDELTGLRLAVCKAVWYLASLFACAFAFILHKIGLHKQVANRLLEPFLWHTVIVTSTEWDNFFEQRCSPLAQPEIRDAALLMRDAMDASCPRVIDVENYGRWHEQLWHLPYVTDEERREQTLDTLIMLSVARCARVSYLNHDGKKNMADDFKLFRRLVTAKPPHLSPLEHVAMPAVTTIASKVHNLGQHWMQLRHLTGVLSTLCREYSDEA